MKEPDPILIIFGKFPVYIVKINILILRYIQKLADNLAKNGYIISIKNLIMIKCNKFYGL